MMTQELLERTPDAATVERIWERVAAALPSRRSKFRVWSGAVAIALALVGTGTAAYAAGAAASRPAPVHTAVSLPDHSLSEYYEELSTLPGFIDGGFTSPAQTSVFAEWYGPLTARARDLIANASAAGQPIEVRFAENSPSQLTADAGKLAAACHRAGIDVWTLAPLKDYSGIAISGPNLTASDRAAIEKIATSTVPGVVVTVVPWSASGDNPVEFGSGGTN